MIFTDIDISLYFILILVLVWLAPVFLDFGYRVRSLRVFRLVTWTLAVAGLTGLYLNPYFYSHQEAKNMAISGPEATSQTADSLSSIGYLMYDSEQYTQALFTRPVNHLALVDYELQPWELKQIQPDTISYHTVNPPSGIIDYQISEPYLGDSLTISLDLAGVADLTVYLSNLDELLDSAKVQAGKAELQTLPKTAGKHLYTVVAKSEAETLFEEKIPVVVRPPLTYPVLMLNSYPSFESRFFKDYLAGEGYQIAVRTSVSTDISNTEYINMKAISLATLSGQTLEKFQLIILDPGAFSSMTSAMQQTIYDLVENGKAGALLINADPQQAGEILKASMNSFTQANREGANDVTYYTVNNPSLSAIRYQERTIGYLRKMGIGAFGYAATKDLYRLHLSGEEAMYHDMLRHLIQSIVPMKQQSGFILLSDDPARIDHEMTITFTSASTNPQLYINDARIPVIESPFRPGFYSTTYWPEVTGWSQLFILPDSQQHAFYVHEKESWKALSEHRLAFHNQLAAQTYRPGEHTAFVFKEKRHISPWIFFTLVIICYGLLWAEQKFINP